MLSSSNFSSWRRAAQPNAQSHLGLPLHHTENYFQLQAPLFRFHRSGALTRRRFDRMSHKMDDLELFRFVTICEFPLIF